MGHLRLGSRASALATWQAEHAKALLAAAHPGVTVELVWIKTQGDAVQDKPLNAFGGQGAFTAELETALREGRIDVAVHSCKDLPSKTAEGLALAAVLERADVRDALVLPQGQQGGLDGLPNGALLGTGSPRREAQLQAYAQALGKSWRFEGVRGNLDTRLAKLDAEGSPYAALVLACAGLDRLGWGERISDRIGVELCVPAAGQGAIALEARADDASTLALLKAVDHRATHAAVAAERAALACLGVGCQAPVGAHAQWQGASLALALAVDGEVESFDLPPVGEEPSRIALAVLGAISEAKGPDSGRLAAFLQPTPPAPPPGQDRRG